MMTPGYSIGVAGGESRVLDWWNQLCVFYVCVCVCVCVCKYVYVCMCIMCM